MCTSVLSQSNLVVSWFFPDLSNCHSFWDKFHLPWTLLPYCEQYIYKFFLSDVRIMTSGWKFDVAWIYSVYLIRKKKIKLSCTLVNAETTRVFLSVLLLLYSNLLFFLVQIWTEHNESHFKCKLKLQVSVPTESSKTKKE